jgi:nicotinamide riboside transporter PnuC
VTGHLALGFKIVEWVCCVFGSTSLAAGIILDLSGNMEMADRIAWRTGWVFGVGLLVCAVEENLKGEQSKAAWITLLAAISLWWWWTKHRGRRRRIAEKAAAKVRDLGHRLTVEPVPVETR